MKAYRFVVALCIALGLILAPVALTPALAAEKARTITVATDATWPPMELVDANKNIVGFDIDFLKAVAKEAGFKVVFKNTAWDGIFSGFTTEAQRRGPKAPRHSRLPNGRSGRSSFARPAFREG